MKTELTEEQMKEVRAHFQEIYFTGLHRKILELDPKVKGEFAHHVAWISFLEGVKYANSEMK